jgi:hypothetical protein
VKEYCGEGVMKMPYGFGAGRGFGFRGSSPPWPYVGRGRGGLPRCAYPGAGAAVRWGGGWGPGWYGEYPAWGAAPYASPASREDELGFLKQEADAIKTHLDGIEARIKTLEGEQE